MGSKNWEIKIVGTDCILKKNTFLILRKFFEPVQKKQQVREIT